MCTRTMPNILVLGALSVEGRDVVRALVCLRFASAACCMVDCLRARVSVCVCGCWCARVVSVRVSLCVRVCTFVRVLLRGRAGVRAFACWRVERRFGPDVQAVKPGQAAKAAAAAEAARVHGRRVAQWPRVPERPGAHIA